MSSLQDRAVPVVGILAACLLTASAAFSEEPRHSAFFLRGYSEAGPYGFHNVVIVRKTFDLTF